MRKGLDGVTSSHVSRRAVLGAFGAGAATLLLTSCRGGWGGLDNPATSLPDRFVEDDRPFDLSQIATAELLKNSDAASDAEGLMRRRRQLAYSLGNSILAAVRNPQNLASNCTALPNQILSLADPAGVSGEYQGVAIQPDTTDGTPQILPPGFIWTATSEAIPSADAGQPMILAEVVVGAQSMPDGRPVRALSDVTGSNLQLLRVDDDHAGTTRWDLVVYDDLNPLGHVPTWPDSSPMPTVPAATPAELANRVALDAHILDLMRFGFPALK